MKCCVNIIYTIVFFGSTCVMEIIIYIYIYIYIYSSCGVSIMHKEKAR